MHESREYRNYGLDLSTKNNMKTSEVTIRKKTNDGEVMRLRWKRISSPWRGSTFTRDAPTFPWAKNRAKRENERGKIKKKTPSCDWTFPAVCSEGEGMTCQQHIAGGPLKDVALGPLSFPLRRLRLLRLAVRYVLLHCKEEKRQFSEEIYSNSDKRNKWVSYYIIILLRRTSV